MGVVNLPSGRPTLELTGGAAASACRAHARGSRGAHRPHHHRRLSHGPGHRHHLGLSVSPCAIEPICLLQRGTGYRGASERVPASSQACRGELPHERRGRRDAREERREGHRPRRHPRAHPGAARAGLPVPALQHSVGLDDPDAAGRRLSVRVEIQLRLQPLFLPVRAQPVLRAHLGQGARPRRRGRVQAAARQRDRLHQARDRPAGRRDPDDPRRAHINGEAGAEGAHRRFRHARPDGPRAAYGPLSGDLAERRELSRARSRQRRHRRQHRSLQSARRPFLHDGRQPRQLDRQPRPARRSASCRSRIWSAARRSSSSRIDEDSSFWQILELADRRPLVAHLQVVH